MIDPSDATQTKPPFSVTRVIVATGPTMVCEAFTALLEVEDDLHSIAAAGTIEVALKTARALAPQVVVVDASICAESEEALVHHLGLLPTKPAIVVLVGPSDVKSAVRLLKAGAVATVTMTAPSSELITAVRLAASGTKWISPPLLAGVLSLLQESPDSNRDGRLGQLTARELEILQLVVDGQSRREIAERLSLSIETVRTHMCRIMNKLDVHSAVAAAAVARAAGLHPIREHSIAL